MIFACARTSKIVKNVWMDETRLKIAKLILMKMKYSSVRKKKKRKTRLQLNLLLSLSFCICVNCVLSPFVSFHRRTHFFFFFFLFSFCLPRFAVWVDADSFWISKNWIFHRNEYTRWKFYIFHIFFVPLCVALFVIFCWI